MRTFAGLLLTVVLLSVGCGKSDFTSVGRYEHGLVVCLGGAGGFTGECDRIRDGLQAAGVNRAIEVFEWSQGGVLEDQGDVKANRNKAGQLARRIEAYLGEYPERPVHLVGVSAGTGLVIWALEDLIEGDKVTGAILISSSLDAKYDLTRALERVTDRIFSFGSVVDTVLSLGVTWAGTVDRGGGIAGGWLGFSPPDNASEHARTLYREKLTQIGWWPGDVILGHAGDHLGATNPAFVRARIAPLVLGREPSPPGPGAPVRANEGRPAGVSRLADARRPEADAPAAQPPKRREAKSPHPPKAEKTKSGQEDKGRFVNWNIGAAATKAATPQTPCIEDEELFAEPGRLP
jgi:pimeloyl-ACP methyl ester carboxylesterase